MDTLARIKKLRAALRVRQNGITHFDAQPIAPFKSFNHTETIDGYVMAQGFYPLGKEWVWIDRYVTLSTLTKLLHRTMPFDTETMPFQTAVQLASEMMFLFEDDVWCCTNHNEVKNEHYRAAHATFEQGVILHDSKYIGLIWIEEED